MEGSKLNAVRDGIKMVRALFRIRATDYQIKRAGNKRLSSP
jgi:hypothetical protein